VAVFADHNKFETIDITGGAPELHPDLIDFIRTLSPLTRKLMIRSNLTLLGRRDLPLMPVLKEYGVNLVASFPSLNEGQSSSIRGRGIFQSSIHALKALNTLGYGMPHSGLELDLVANPSGAFLSPSQGDLEKRFKKTLERKWGIMFNHLFSFANVPLGRFESWLIQSGNYENYLQKLVSAFNPEALDGVMCKTLLSVSWDGYVYDCDFNQAADLAVGNRKTHIADLNGPPPPGSPVAAGDHCYTCTAGAGFT
jgi:radical SAM/Cys-rich protein